MNDTLPAWQLAASLACGLALVLLLTLRARLHPFLALLAASMGTGWMAGWPLVKILEAFKEGFGHINQSLCLLIVLGTLLGGVLERKGFTESMARWICARVGASRSDWALALAGFCVGLPIFCDSGFVVLSGLLGRLSLRSGKSMVTLAASLAAGLYGVHCLLPPHPGMAAATTNLGLEPGRVIGWGLVVAIPATLAGLAWIHWITRKDLKDPGPEYLTPMAPGRDLPKAHWAFLPVLVPIALISLRSWVSTSGAGPSANILRTLSEPAVALGIGLLLALATARGSGRGSKENFSGSLEKAGAILLIIGAGGGFGFLIGQLHPEKYLPHAGGAGSWGLWLPFVVALLLKTVQGSSTVAILTAASLVAPLLGSLGLDSQTGRLLVLLAMGSGSLALSHANDAYFWVIVKFSGLDIRQVFRTYSVATVWMAAAAMTMVMLLARVL